MSFKFEYKYYECFAMFVWFSVMYWINQFLVYYLTPSPAKVKVAPNESKELDRQQFWFWYIEYNSWLHALISIILGGYSIYRDGTRYTDLTTSLEYMIMMNTTAYFVYDCIIELKLDIIDTENLIHHVVSAVPMVASIYLDYGGSVIVAFTFWSELSNP